MNNRPKNATKSSRQGAILLLTALSFILLIGVGALVADVGWLYYKKLKLQTSVNAAWKAGYDRMMELGGVPLDDVKKEQIAIRVREIFLSNGYINADASQLQVSFPNNNTLQVYNTITIDLMFAKALGYQTADISALHEDIPGGDNNNGGGIVPLAIPQGVVKDMSLTTFSCDFFPSDSGFKPGIEYILKLGGDQTLDGGGKAKDKKKTTGGMNNKNKPVGVERQKNNYGIVDPDNVVIGGVDDYLDRFKYGFSHPLQINDRLIPESENLEVPTDQSVAFRVFGNATESPSIRVIVSITDIGPEVLANNSENAAALSIYDILGQDDPNGIYNPASFPFGAAVRVIGFAEFEIIPVASYTRTGTFFETGDVGPLGDYQPGQVRGKFIRYIVRPGEIGLN